MKCHSFHYYRHLDIAEQWQLFFHDVTCWMWISLFTLYFGLPECISRTHYWLFIWLTPMNSLRYVFTHTHTHTKLNLHGRLQFSTTELGQWSRPELLCVLSVRCMSPVENPEVTKFYVHQILFHQTAPKQMPFTFPICLILQKTLNFVKKCKLQ